MGDITVKALNHAGVFVKDFEKSTNFYERILGLKKLPRPPFPGMSGAWYGVGENQLHVNQWDAVAEKMTGPKGHNPIERHVAIVVNDVEAVRKALDAENIPYDFFNEKFGDVEIKAIYTRDYDGNCFEIRTGYPMPGEGRPPTR